MFAGENDLKKLGDDLQNQLDLFVKTREEKKQQEIEHKKMLEFLAEQKKKEEEEARKKKEEEEAAAAEAEALKVNFHKKFLKILKSVIVICFLSLKQLLEMKKAAEALEGNLIMFLLFSSYIHFYLESFFLNEVASPKGSAKNKKLGKDSKADRSKSPKKNKSPEKEKPTTPKSPAKKNSGKGTKGKVVTPPPPQEEQVAKVEEPISMQPGSDEYVYLNEKIEPRMAKIMCDHWDVIENSYVDNSKFVFRKIRTEREQIIRYFFAIKNNFKDYLKRPDTKQLEIESFVKVQKKIF